KQPHEYQRDEHRVHRMISHLIWCPRRRTPVLVGPVAARCRELIAGTGDAPGWKVRALALQPDHLHWFVRAWPNTRAADVVKACQGLTVVPLRHAFPHLLKLPSMWTRSYFASTAGHVSQEPMQRDRDAQTGR